MNSNISENSQTLAENDREFLHHLQEMQETDLMKDVLVPLFHKLGFEHVRYNHGPQERGKDIVYCERDAFDELRLKVAQVKNTPFDGNAASANNAFTVLRQLEMSSGFEVLNPVTSLKEKPTEVVFVTTYPLQDYQFADGRGFLESLKSAKVIILTPEKIVSLIKRHLPKLYNSHVAPTLQVTEAIERHLSVHHEYSAFQCTKPRMLATFVVNLSLAPALPLLADLLFNDPPLLQAAFRRYQDVQGPVFVNVATSFLALPRNLRQKPLVLASRESKEERTEREITNRHDLREMLEPSPKVVTTTTPDLMAFKAAVIAGIAPVSGRSTSSLADHIDPFLQCEEVLEHLLDLAIAGRSEDEDNPEVIERALRELKKQILIGNPDRHQNWESIVADGFENIEPGDIANSKRDFFIVGVAGGGKTTLARSVAVSHLQEGKCVVYFPCMRLNNSSLHKQLIDYLVSLPMPIDRETANRYVEECDLLVFDGLDEAPIPVDIAMGKIASYATGLGDADDKPAEFETNERPSIPLDLRDVVTVKTMRKKPEKPGFKSYQLQIQRRLTQGELGRLRVLNGGSGFLLALEQILERVRGKSIVVTCRSSETVAVPKHFTHMSLRPMSDKQMVQFFERWLLDTNKDSAELVAYVNKHSRLKTVCRTPIVATILVTLFESGSDLPMTKTEVYELRHKLLFGGWDTSKGIENRNKVRTREKLHCISRLALQMHRRKVRLFDRDSFLVFWNREFSRLHPNVSADDVLDELIRLNGVVFVEAEDSFSFGHLSFQEHLAALAVMWQQRKSILTRECIDPWWHEVAIFYCGLTGDCADFLEPFIEEGGIPSGSRLVSEMSEEGVYTRQDFQDYLHHAEEEMGDWEDTEDLSRYDEEDDLF